MEKKTLSELYQECKLKQEMEQKRKELLAQLAKDFFDAPVRFGPPPIPPIPPIPQSFQGNV